MSLPRGAEMRSQFTTVVLLAAIGGSMYAAETTRVNLAAEVTFSLHRAGHTLIFETVYLNGQGPFRMMVDTGNASSLIRPQVAQKLGARASYSVEQVTSAGIRRVPVIMIDQLAVGPVVDRQIEAMISPVAMDGVDGILGQSWLVRHDYLLGYRNRRLVLDGAAPDGAMRTDLRSVEGRPRRRRWWMALRWIW
jgi:predicted aspartyl protease